jgi:hypothetical protein
MMTSDPPDDGGSKHLSNVGKLLPDTMTQHLRRQSSSTYRLQGYERSMRGAIYI